MMITKILQRVFLLIFIVVPVSVAADDDEYSAIYVFGDSLSDTGNLAVLQPMFVPNPPYAEGKFSNGPLAVEVLAERLDLEVLPAFVVLGGTNFAVAGARAVTDGLFLNLPEQVSAFLGGPGYVPSDALYIVFIGGNDVRDALLAGGGEAGDNIVLTAAAGVGEAVQTLAMAGAEEILIANAPDLGAIPETPDQFSKEATRLTRLFNRKLAKNVKKIKKEFDVDIIRFNTFKFVKSVIAKADKLGLDDTENACIFSVPFPFDCSAFLFYDTIHPTKQVHELAGEAMLELVRDNDDEDDDDDYDNDD